MDHEDNLGVPFPGVALPRARWTQTGVARLPLNAHFDWAELFARTGPVALDLGCGNGRSTIGLAVAHPQTGYLGCDVLPVVIRHAIRRANHRGLINVRFAVAPALEVLQRLVRPASVTEIHLYHPQPYADLAEWHRRLITPEFLTLAWQALSDGGQLFLQTDNTGYWDYLRAAMPIFFAFAERADVWPDAPMGRTRREILARARGLPIYRGIGVKRADLNLQEAIQRAEQLAAPVFDSRGRRSPRDGGS